MERSTELLFLKKRVHELLQDKADVDEVQRQAEREIQDVKAKAARDVKALRDRVLRLGEENAEYRRVFEDMGSFFGKVNDF